MLCGFWGPHTCTPSVVCTKPSLSGSCFWFVFCFVLFFKREPVKFFVLMKPCAGLNACLLWFKLNAFQLNLLEGSLVKIAFPLSFLPLGFGLGEVVSGENKYLHLCSKIRSCWSGFCYIPSWQPAVTHSWQTLQAAVPRQPHGTFLLQQQFPHGII